MEDKIKAFAKALRAIAVLLLVLGLLGTCAMLLIV